MKGLKTILFGIAFILTGGGLLAIPEIIGVFLYLGFFLMLTSLIIAIVGACKKESPDGSDKN